MGKAVCALIGWRNVSDRRVFCNRRLDLRLESVRQKEDAELLVLLFGRKRTSIYARSSLFATLPPGACPADSFSYLCAAEPLRTGKSQPKYGLFRRKKGLDGLYRTILMYGKP